MDEIESSYLEYLAKLAEGLDRCVKNIEELKIEAEETILELKKDELPKDFKEDKKWQEVEMRFKRVQMVAVEARLSYALSVVKQETERVAGWLEEIKRELKK